MEGQTRKLAPLVGLRGVAAYTVLLAHALDTLYLYPAGLGVFHAFAYRLAYFGMSLFFVLSGFVLFYTYGVRFAEAGRHLGAVIYEFFIARLARLYPLYLFGLVVYSPVELPDMLRQHTGVLLAYATLTQSWFNVQNAFFPPDWSISTEWLFYVAFVPIVLFLARLRRPLLALVVYCGVAAAGIFALFRAGGTQLEASVQHHLYWGPALSASADWWLYYTNPPLRLLEFIAGMLAAKFYVSFRPLRQNQRALSGVVCIASLYCLSLIGFAPLDGILRQVLPNIAFAVALAALLPCVCFSTGWVHRILSTRPLQFMGEISYSVYMWSFLVLRLFPPIHLDPGFSTADFLSCSPDAILAMVMTTLLASGSYQMIELPAQKRIRLMLQLPGRVRPPSPRVSIPQSKAQAATFVDHER